MFLPRLSVARVPEGVHRVCRDYKHENKRRNSAAINPEFGASRPPRECPTAPRSGTVEAQLRGPRSPLSMTPGLITRGKHKPSTRRDTAWVSYGGTEQARSIVSFFLFLSFF